MALKTFKPYTKSTRGTILVDRTGLWKGKPFKSLVSPKNAMKGRNNYGRITSINRAGGHKQCVGLWIASGNYMCQWKLTRAEVDVPETSGNHNFLPDSDAEDDDDVVASGGGSTEAPPAPSKVTPKMLDDTDSEGEPEGENVEEEPEPEPEKKKVTKKKIIKKGK